MITKNYTPKFLIAAMSVLFMLKAFSASAQVPVVDVKDSIATDTHWSCNNQYLLFGYVYVTKGHTLTIDAGTIIKGDKDTKGSLIVERGAKIYAIGTPTNPIVFTSNQPAGQRNYGDWGGVILCGYSPTNWATGQGQVEGGPRSLYGGTDPHDNTGIMEYCRIEFPGIAFSPNNEINGLTFCSVGDSTIIDHIQVSYSGDDSYEWFGGSVNTRYLVAFRGWDDDFDTDNGYNGYDQYGIGLRDPFAADQSGSKGFESDSYQTGTVSGLSGDTTGLTKPVFVNYTMIGPLVSPTSTAYDPQYVAAAHIRRGTSISLINDLLVGFPCGILFDESSSQFGSTVANLQDSHLQIRGTVVAGIPATNAPGRKEVFYVIDGARSLTPTNVWADTTTGTPFAPFAGPFSWFENAPFMNHIFVNEQTGLRLQDPFDLDHPDFVPTSTSPICYNPTKLPTYVTTHYGNTDPFHNGGVYPYNPILPINTDTSNFFASYNAPGLVPVLNSWKTQNPFFTVENHVGAMNYSGNLTDDWTKPWTDFTPELTDYSGLDCVTGIDEVESGHMTIAVYPNPTYLGTWVEFQLTKPTQVMVTLYDASGRSLGIFNNSVLNPGVNRIPIPAKNLAAGVYYVKVQIGNGTETKKLVVLK